MGRTSILLVMGFNMIFLLMGFSLSRVSTTAYENYVDYYTRSMAHNLSGSAANMAAAQFMTNTAWRTGFSNVSFSGGLVNANVVDLDSNRVRITATGTFNNEAATTVITLGPSRFSKFAYYSFIEGSIYWITGDTCWGPLHTQQKLNVSGNPVFFGKASAKNGLFKSPSSSKPKFLGGFQTGVDLQLPTDFNPLRTAATGGGKMWSNENVWLDFKSDGKVVVREGSATATPQIVDIATLAPNGVMFVDGGNLHIKGILNGKVTIAATGSSGAAKGNVWVDSSIVYSRNPLNGWSPDMLGIVADNDVIVTDNSNNNNPAKGVTIHASILSRSGGLKAENYNSRPVAGTLTLLGGVQQYQRGPVGTFSGSHIVSGFQKNYRYDGRLANDFPPFYPATQVYEVLSWFE